MTRARFGSGGYHAPIRHVDLTLLGSVMALTVLGAVAVRSASAQLLRAQGADPERFLKRQLIFFALASVVFALSLLVDYRQLAPYTPLAYAALLFALILVLTPLGQSAKGAQRWINLGPIQIQPAEMMKLGYIAFLAAVLSRERDRAGEAGGIKPVIQALALALLPALLIYLQPDLGTVFVLLAIAFAVLMVAGTRLRWLMLVLAGGVLMVGLALKLDVLHEYQVARLTAFLDNRADPQRSGFNLAQSKIAIGSGGVAGKGWGKGSQTNLSYIPEQRTDFIFTAIAEEKGFIGGVTVLILFGIVLWRCIRAAMLSRDLFGALVAGGVAAMFGFQLFVNIGMTMGIMPITGVPLPFVSYGGSSLITSFLGVGLVMNVHMRRFV